MTDDKLARPNGSTWSRHQSGASLSRSPEVMHVGDYLSLLRRRWLILLVCPLLTVGAVYWWSGQIAQIYSSRTEILVLPPSSDPLDGSGAPRYINVFTEAELVQSAPVLGRAVVDLGLSASGEVQERLTVEADDDAKIIRIQYEDETPERAQQGAAAIANAYLDHRNELSVAALARTTAQLDQRVMELEQELDEATRALATANSRPSPDEAEIAALRGRQSLLVTQLSLAQNQLAGRSLIELSPGEILQPATLEMVPVGLGRTRMMLIAFGVGLLVAIGVAVLRDRFDPRVRGDDELEWLAGIAAVERLRLTPRGMLRTSTHDRPGRRLAVTISQGQRSRDVHVTAVTPIADLRLAGLVAASLADALGVAGGRVLLLLPDPEKEGAWHVPGHSVAGARQRGDEITRVSTRWGAPGLGVLSAGDLEEYDHLVVAAPAVTESADLLEYSSSVQSIVLVADVRQTQVRTIKKTVQLLEGLDVAPTALVTVASPNPLLSMASRRVFRVASSLSFLARIFRGSRHRSA
jgi:capsular polysaccharide biosynthesis protein